jgi:tetratricopeptide (TPR) repeat protein
VTYGGRALRADPQNPDVLDTYGWALHHAGRSPEALPFLERALAGKPRMFCIHFHLGEVYAALGDRERAERHLREQIRRHPGGSEARRAEASLRWRGLIVAATLPPDAPGP